MVAAAADELAVARPTAVNLAWGVARAREVLDGEWADAATLRAGLAEVARGIHDDEVCRCREMGAHGAELFGERRRSSRSATRAGWPRAATARRWA